MRNFLSICLFILITACSDEDRYELAKVHNDSHLELWDSVIETSLNEPLWLYPYAYDAAASLMVPMHYAFKHHKRFNHDPRESFSKFFRDTYKNVDFTSYEGTVTRYQFIYFITQYLKLRAVNELIDEKDLEILFWLEKELQAIWLEEDAFHWDKNLDFRGVKDRLEWNLSFPDTKYSFYRAIIDQDWFTIAALNDLLFTFEVLGLDSQLNNAEIRKISFDIIDKHGTKTKEYWFFQQGIWHDHRDYRYAGNSIVEEQLEPAIIEDIGIDSNHMHRLPLWLASFKDNNPSEKTFYENVIKLHKNTYEDLVLTSVTDKAGNHFIAQNNYSTGQNGVYRYNYATQGNGNGYGPFELSGTLFIGYYLFMGSVVYESNMKDMISEFPLPQTALSIYVGPNTTRVRHPMFSWPNYFNNGFAEMFSILVACHNTSLENCEASSL